MDISTSFAAISRQAQIFYTRELLDMNISYGQMMCVLCVCDNPGLSQDEIAVLMLLDKSTVSPLLLMEKLKYGFDDLSQHKRITPMLLRLRSLLPSG